MTNHSDTSAYFCPKPFRQNMKISIPLLLGALATFTCSFAQLQSPTPEAGETLVQKVVDAFAEITNDTGGPGQSYDLTYLFNPDWGATSVAASFVSVASTPNGKVFT